MGTLRLGFFFRFCSVAHDVTNILAVGPSSAFTAAPRGSSCGLSLFLKFSRFAKRYERDRILDRNELLSMYVYAVAVFCNVKICRKKKRDEIQCLLSIVQLIIEPPNRDERNLI